MTSVEHAMRRTLSRNVCFALAGLLGAGAFTGSSDRAAAQPETKLASRAETRLAWEEPPADTHSASSGIGQPVPRALEPDLGALLSSLATSPRSQQLASEVQTMIERGENEPAQQLLSDVIEAGTLAALIETKLKSDELLPSLRVVGNPPPQVDASPAPSSTADGGKAEGRDVSVDGREQDAQLLSTAISERDAARADLERHRAESAEREADRQAASERSQSALAALERERDAAFAQIATLRETDREVARLQAALVQANERADAAAEATKVLEQQLSSLRTENGRLAQLAEATAEQLARAEEMRSSLEHQLAAAGAIKEDLAALQAKLEQERSEAEAASVQHARLEEEVVALRQTNGEMSDLRQELAREKDRVAQLLSELEQVKRQLDRSADARTGHPVKGQEQDAGMPAEEAPHAVGSVRVLLPAETRQASDRLLKRAEELVRARDIIGARSILDRAIDLGDNRALHLLAQTYDPQMLREWHVIGDHFGDPTRAQELYMAAKAKSEEIARRETGRD